MKLQYSLFAGVLTSFLALPAFANDASVATIPQLSTHDTQILFEQDAMPMELVALTSQEMKETEGAVIWFAPVAWGGARYALTGFTRHGLNQVISRENLASAIKQFYPPLEIQRRPIATLQIKQRDM